MNGVTFFQKHLQEIKTDPGSGSTYWSVNSGSMSFTWFEVPPNSAFSVHTHPNEQITYVLEGKLFFESEGRTYSLRKGDCIVIPPDAPHRAWTTELGARAVDAWCPPNQQYE